MENDQQIENIKMLFNRDHITLENLEQRIESLETQILGLIKPSIWKRMYIWYKCTFPKKGSLNWCIKQANHIKKVSGHSVKLNLKTGIYDEDIQIKNGVNLE